MESIKLTSAEWEALKVLNDMWDDMPSVYALFNLAALLGPDRYRRYMLAVTERRQLNVQIDEVYVIPRLIGH